MGTITKPTAYLNWTDGNVTKIVQPTTAQALSGWTSGQPVTFQNLNWLFWDIDQWIQYFDAITSSESSLITVIPLIRLINGGSWSYVNSSGVLTWSSAFNLAVPSIPDASNQAASGNVTLTDGQVAYVIANIPFTTTGNTTNTSNQITGVAEELGITVGMTVTGTGIPGSTTVTAINTSTNTLTISANATATNSGVTLTFSGTGALTVTAATESALVPSASMVIVARRVGANIFLGVNSGQMVIRDGESKTLLAQGYGGVITATAGENLTAGQLVYLSIGGADGSRTAGSAYRCDASGANGSGRQSAVGVVMTTVSSSGTANIITSGLVGLFSGLTAGKNYYADPGTLGGVTATQPTQPGYFVVPVGTAYSSTQMALSGLADTNPAILPAGFLATAGTTIAALTPVYISPGTGVDGALVAGDIYACDSGVTNGAVRSLFCGFTVSSAAGLNSTVQVAQSGILGGFSSLTPGAVYYVNPSSPGGITTTIPATSGQYIVPVGVAISATQMAIDAALAGGVTVVTTANAYPNYFAANETQLGTAITSATSNGGGVICLQNSFTISSAHTIPANTLLLGRRGGSILTVASSGALTFSADGASMQDVFFTTALSSGSLVTLSGNYCIVRGCQFTVPPTSTCNCILVSGNSNRMYNNIFVGVAGDSGEPYGINYSAGVDNLDDSSVFLP